MSAIFGIVHLNGEPVDVHRLQTMESKLRHYGRDEQAIEIVAHNIGLGCCLNTEISPLAAEVPVYSDDDFVVIGDVQIYNRSELRVQLTENSQITNQELLLSAYKKWGIDCPMHINGDFVFAIWEKQRQQLLIIRDHLGVRPLYYFYNGASFAFATDFRALLVLPFVGRQFDEVTLYATLTNTYHIDPEATDFAQIKRLPQAHRLKVDAHGMDKQKYWTPGKSNIVFATEDEYAQAMYDVVADAIKIRVTNRAKIAAELSGGLDSSVVTILANRELKKEDEPLEYFSWSPPYELIDKQLGDERQLIELVCEQEGLHGQYYDPRLLLEKTRNEIELGFGGGKVFDQEYRQLTAQGVKLVLTGWGGDQGISHRCGMYELLVNGYWRYFWEEALHRSKGSPWRLFKTVIANSVLPLFGPFSYFGNPNKGIPSIVNEKFANKLKPHCKKNILYFGSKPVKHLESGNIQTRTELTAWFGAHYNVQHVYPFLDYRVVDFAMSIPRHWFLKQGINRYLYRKAFAHILPPEVCGFTSKDDIARSTYSRGKEAEALDKLTLDANQLQRGLFSAYIGWDKFDKLLQSPLLKTDLRIRYTAHRKIQMCNNIQQILAEADRDS
ncbi:MAG: asparagine synthase-related protein [Desulfosporosinus sp.]|nr:asparagine synthase-related protein [Desulfosporosinus sp.]